VLSVETDVVRAPESEGCPACLALWIPLIVTMLCARRRALSALLHRRSFTVLAIESSADDTCAAVVTSDKRILSNVVITQLSLCVHAYSTLEPFSPPIAMNSSEALSL
jgi:hypothetical protein